jgi:hypothetical protein
VNNIHTLFDCQAAIVDNVHMIKMPRMGRKPLGKEKYHFTCPPDLMERFDRIAAELGTTRSDLLVTMIRGRVERDADPKRKRK